MSLVETQEVEVMEGMIKGMLVQKPQDEQATKREQAPLKKTLKEVRRIKTPKRIMLKNGPKGTIAQKDMGREMVNRD